MKKRTFLFRTVMPFLFVGLVFGVCGATAQEAADDDRAAVEAANEKYLAALDAMLAGDPTPLKEVWWQTEEVVYMSSDGDYLVGWNAIYANWEQKAAQNMGGHAEAEQVRTTIVGDTAITYQYVVAVLDPDGQSREVKPRVTSVFQKKDGQWKLIGRHVDVVTMPGQEVQKP